MKNIRKSYKKLVGGALILLMMVSVFCVPFTSMAFAAGNISFTKNLPSEPQTLSGGSLVLSVEAKAADGAAIRYEWYKDGAAISGATSATYTVSTPGEYSVKAINQSNEGDFAESQTCTVTEPQSGNGQLYVAGYSVVDNLGNPILYLTPETHCKIVFLMVDGRVLDSDVPQGTDLKSYIHITPTSKAFSSCSNGDIWLDREAPVDGSLTYSLTFNDITYLDTTAQDNTLSFDVSVINNSTPGAPIANLPLTSVSQSIGQCSKSKDETVTSGAKPTFMVKDSNYGGGNIAAGQNFTLTLTSYNTSRSTAISDVVTTITLPQTLTLAAGSNTVLTESVPAGGSYQTTFTLQAQSSAETGVANVTVEYRYYIKGTDEQLTSSQLITVPIVQPDRFSFTSMDLPQEMYAGEENTITVNYVNKGKGILYNLTAEISGNINTPGQQQYLGNLNSGTEGSADFTIQTDQPGTVSGTITLTYEDVNGNEKKQTQDYSLTVSEMPTYDDMPDMDMDAMGDMDMQQGMPVWGWVLIGVGVVAVIVAVVVIVKKKKAKRRAELLAEDNDDEDF